MSPYSSWLLGPGLTIARPFLLWVWSVAFSTPEQKFYNRLSFVDAGNQGALAKGFHDRVPSPLRGCRAGLIDHHRPALSFIRITVASLRTIGLPALRGRWFLSRLCRSGGHVAASSSACTPRKRPKKWRAAGGKQQPLISADGFGEMGMGTDGHDIVERVHA